MIPKIIHYCWFSEERKPDSVRKCLASWQKYLPEYEIKCWDSSCFEIIQSDFARTAYENKKWAFASDYVRLFALYNEGGIYLDSDVQVWSSLDNLLDNDFFTGLEMRNKEHTDIYLEAAIMGACKGNEFIKSCIEKYDSRSFVRSDGSFDLTPIPTIISEIFETIYPWKREDTLQTFNGHTVYPTGVIANTNCERIPSVKLYHLNNRSWIPLTAKEKIIRIIRRFLPK